MKIRLLEPNSPSMHLWSHSYFVRLGLPLIGAALKAAGHDVLIYAEQLAPVDWDDVYGADFVGISSTTSTITEAYKCADELRRRGIPVIMGGSHVTFMADEALEHADYVARGESGETIMLELAEALEGERELEGISGLSFKKDGKTVHNPLHERCDDLDTLPFPDLSLVVGNERIENTPIMTSWGCPFACNFCSVTAMFGRKYRFRSAESVVAEIKEKKPKKIFFYDDNFAADKKRLKTLLRMMIAEGITVPWGAQVRTDVVKDRELLELMRASGADFVALGLESVNQATLDSYEKSQTVEDIEKSIRILHDYGVRSHGMFVLGADSDTENVVRDTVDFALKNHIDTVMLNILTPLPGTQQFADLDAAGRIITRDWYLYDAQHVVFLPKHMSPATLQREVIRGNKRFFYTWRPVKAFVMWTAGRRKLAYNRMLEYGWCWYYSRMWGRDERNRAHMRLLERQRPAAAPRPSAEAATAGMAGRRKPD
ncbi:MAG TPA: radical SAM protein [Thermoleophilia bacterium]|nr:radical SAM protein [Thermoleophilia bacterium]